MQLETNWKIYRSHAIKEREPNSAAALASQPAAGHSLSFIYCYCFMTLGWGLLVGLAAESCSRIWLPRLSDLKTYKSSLKEFSVSQVANEEILAVVLGPAVYLQ